MRLEQEVGEAIEDPTPEAVERVLRGLRVARNHFAILETDRMHYIQTARGDDGSLMLEYQDGSLSEHYEVGPVPLTEVIAAFQSYLGGDGQWRSRFAWQKPAWLPRTMRSTRTGRRSLRATPRPSRKREAARKTRPAREMTHPAGAMRAATAMHARQSQLEAMYDFAFPDDFFLVWELACELNPVAPQSAFRDLVGITLVGPYDVLAGRFEGKTLVYSPLLHWRFRLDPPEFFTVLAGHTDGLHHGYWLDDPAQGPSCVVSYYSRDAYELQVEGITLLQALRLNLEYHHRDALDYMHDYPEDADTYREQLDRMASLRSRIRQYATGDRDETGADYTENYGAYAAWKGTRRNVIAPTPEGMGIVAAAALYRPLTRDLDALPWKLDLDQLADVIAEARNALQEGYPATALKLGKHLWIWGDGDRVGEALTYEFLDAAYAGLGRSVLRDVLRVHWQNRDLPNVNILSEYP